MTEEAIPCTWISGGNSNLHMPLLYDTKSRDGMVNCIFSFMLKLQELKYQMLKTKDWRSNFAANTEQSIMIYATVLSLMIIIITKTSLD